MKWGYGKRGILYAVLDGNLIIFKRLALEDSEKFIKRIRKIQNVKSFFNIYNVTVKEIVCYLTLQKNNQ